jgi:hypothetical protein
LGGPGRIGGGAIEEEGDGLRAAVHVQNEASAGIGEQHEHAWVINVGRRVIICDLG